MSNSAQLETVGWVLLATLLGALLGAEREFRGHEAGIRTSGLVAGAAGLFGRVSLEFGGDDRIAAGVVQGIGFLGAGLILRRGHGIAGVTTAATTWAAAAIGLAVAAELWLSALIVAAAYIGLLELAPVSDWVYTTGRRRRTPLVGAASPEDLPERDDREADDDPGGR